MIKQNDVQGSSNSSSNIQTGQPKQGFKSKNIQYPQHPQHPQHHEGNQFKNYQKDNTQRQSFQNQSSAMRPKTFSKLRPDETVEDIKSDITRIQKEIDFEIKEIKSLRLGM